MPKRSASFSDSNPTKKPHTLNKENTNQIQHEMNKITRYIMANMNFFSGIEEGNQTHREGAENELRAAFSEFSEVPTAVKEAYTQKMNQIVPNTPELQMERERIEHIVSEFNARQAGQEEKQEEESSNSMRLGSSR